MNSIILQEGFFTEEVVRDLCSLTPGKIIVADPNYFSFIPQDKMITVEDQEWQ